MRYVYSCTSCLGIKHQLTYSLWCIYVDGLDMIWLHGSVLSVMHLMLMGSARHQHGSVLSVMHWCWWVRHDISTGQYCLWCTWCWWVRHGVSDMMCYCFSVPQTMRGRCCSATWSVLRSWMGGTTDVFAKSFCRRVFPYQPGLSTPTR